MPHSLLEYADGLDERDLLWPAPPEPMPVKATPYLEKFPDIRAVTWSVYGTLLMPTDGRLRPIVRDRMRMEVALEKTIHEFNMWNSMSRKPGAPWEYMLQQFESLVEDQKFTSPARKGETAEADLPHVWRKLIERLQQKDFTWDEPSLGDIDEFSEKVAYFFQSCLQGLAASPNALAALSHVRRAGCKQGLIADGQSFTLVQLARALRTPEKAPSLGKLFSSGCVSLSYAIGVRQPAESLFEACLETLDERGISPSHVLHVASRLKEELAPAKRLGLRTALYAGDKRSLEATPAEIADPALRPDRILTDLRQIRQIVKADEG